MLNGVYRMFQFQAPHKETVNPIHVYSSKELCGGRGRLVRGVAVVFGVNW